MSAWATARRRAGRRWRLPRLKVARLAADEFGILVSDAGSVEDVLATAHELLQVVQAPIRVPGQDITPVGPGGVAVMPDHATEADAILKAAETASTGPSGSPANPWRCFRKR